MLSTLRSFAGSIVTKFAAMLLVIGGLTVAALWTSFTLFGEFSASLGRFQDEVVPSLAESSEIIEISGDLGESLSALLIAGSTAEMTQSFAQAQAAVDRLRQSASGLDGSASETLLANVDEVTEDLARVAAAREDDIVFDETTLSGSDALSTAVGTASGRLIEIAGQAYRTLLESEAEETVLAHRRSLERMGQAAELERLLGEVQSIVLTGASADDAEGVERAQTMAGEMVARMIALSEGFADDAAISGAIAEVEALAGPAKGILAARLTVIEAREAADAASREAARHVGAITKSARDLGRASMGEIESASGRLQSAAAGGRSTMMTIAGTSALALLLAAAATILLIVRPLVAVTRVTERLAQGDLRPVLGFERHRGEIGRMASALSVFRDGMIERQRLEEEERTREAAERDRVAREERQTREREEAERIRRAAADAEARERELAELQQRETLREEAEAEREARAAEQERVVSSLAQGMKKLAEGDFAVRLTETFPSAYESLRGDFNDAVSTLSDLIGQIAESAARIDEGSTEISSATHELSRRTETSAATLEETAAALDELTSSVASAAEGAAQANEVAHATNTKAETSREVVSEAVSAMSQIEDSSRKIAHIIEVIDDIAFQTNLLALNAGVEAARAGEAGRGFAVVASEVRELAQRSSDAARKINALISTSNEHVSRGVQMVDEAGSALQEIITGVAEITRNVGEIAASAREQASGINEINAATGQLDGAMQQNSAMTEETTAASQLLLDESRKLREMIRHFRVSGAHGAADGILRSLQVA